MRHFVAYHNTEKMGQTLHEGDPLGLLTNKPVQQLPSNMVWFVQGDGVTPKHYSLGSVFLVKEVGETDEAGFKQYAHGKGHVFRPPVPLHELEWFPDFFKAIAHFSVGVQEVKDERFITSRMRCRALKSDKELRTGFFRLPPSRDRFFRTYGVPRSANTDFSPKRA
jgi:hypothetical protein